MFSLATVAATGCPIAGDPGEITTSETDTGTDGTKGASASSGEPELTTTKGVSDSTTGDGSTMPEEPSTTDGSSTMDIGSGDDTSSGSDSTTGDVSTMPEEPSTTDGSSTMDTGGDTDTGDTDTGDTDGDTGGLLGCCEPGCHTPLLVTNTGKVTVHHSGARIATHDEHGFLALWNADTLALVTRASGVDGVQLIGGALVYRREGLLHIVDAGDGSPLGQCAADAAWGLARDGSYVWTADAQGLSIHELDGSVRWSVPGALSDVKVLATADAVHAFDVDLEPQAVVHLAATDGTAESAAFQGVFGGWFADVPRYWTTQGQSYRVYDTNATELTFAVGKPYHGWGTRVAVGKGDLPKLTVFDVFAPNVSLATLPGYPDFSGPAALTVDIVNDNETQLVRLDLDPITKTTIMPALGAGNSDPSSFAWSNDAWVVGGKFGLSADQLGRLVSVGDVVGLAAAPTGRVAAGVNAKLARVFDVNADCSVTTHPYFARAGAGLWMSGDGSLLLSAERWVGPNLGNPNEGTRFYSLPDAGLLAGTQLDLFSSKIVQHDVADDGSLWSRSENNTDQLFKWTADVFPLGPAMLSGAGDVVPKVAPDAQHVVTSDGKANKFGTWVGGQSYVFAPDELVAVFDGITHGFLDDTHLLVGHYAAPGEVFVGSEIVDITGVVVQETTLPDIRRFTRIGTGEILAVLHPSGDAAIFNPQTGAQLWAAPPGTEVAVAGEDFVVVSDDANVDLVRWR